MASQILTGKFLSELHPQFPIHEYPFLSSTILQLVKLLSCQSLIEFLRSTIFFALKFRKMLRPTLWNFYLNGRNFVFILVIRLVSYPARGNFFLSERMIIKITNEVNFELAQILIISKSLHPIPSNYRIRVQFYSIMKKSGKDFWNAV